MPDAAPLAGPLEPIFLAGSINLLAGSSGVGKTVFLAYLARLLQERHALFGVQPEHSPYLAYVGGVDKSWRRSSSKWFGLEGLNIRHYCLADDGAFRKKRLRAKADRTAIFQECLLKVTPDGKTFPPGALVFFDPLSLFLGGNLLDYDTAAVACAEMREVLQDHGHPALLGTVHGGKIKSDKKQGYARLQDHILGTAALYGYSDTQLYLASPEELKTKTSVLYVGPHHAPPQTLNLARELDGRFCFAGAPQPIIPPPSWIIDVLAKAPERTLEFGALLMEAVDREVGQKKLQRQLAGEITAGRVERVGHGKYRLVRPS